MSETPTTVWSMTRTPTSDMSRRQRRGRRFLTVSCAALLVAGCGSPPTARPPASPAAHGPWTGVLAQDRAVWSAEPSIDLLTGPAVAIRAYQESYFVASLMGSEEYLYPGFAHAVAPNAPSTAPLSAQGRWPSTSHPAPHPMVGNEQWHILRIDTSGQDLTAVVCDWGLYTRAFDLGDGNYGYIGETHGAGVDALWISMTAPAAAPTPPLPPQKGPALAPVDDVFGGWRINGFIEAFGGVATPEWPSAAADVGACAAKAPVPLDRRTALRNGNHPRSDFPTLPAYPGWPAASSS